VRNNDVQHEKLHAPWREFTNSDEEQRLIKLDGRIERRKTLLDWDVKERTRIMNRAIRRMRRAEGKA
jgi:hypothetical protein